MGFFVLSPVSLRPIDGRLSSVVAVLGMGFPPNDVRTCISRHHRNATGADLFTLSVGADRGSIA
ncbi:hypothetical protein ZHAS_00021017 [Anopheles sinensis]|uniref:Uncharacterized protein n=1 Tax=Anopheles sinensis TaxID=74873 RepID=A0A084WR80_ANOSI|nr:hypothetical protein ZHAS_00021017 [Anopheles sinensis]